ncbi:TPA: beta-1,6-N-acetylglucosaminyltransferase [Streptococcus suis]
MKFAYLVMVHEFNSILETLLTLLDDSRNDIFIHVDKKSNNFSYEKIEQFVKESQVFYVPQVDVIWGDVSQINAEMALLEYATSQNSYDYYHLLSGSDLPLKSQDEIHEFFKMHKGDEFVDFFSAEFSLVNRVNYYNLFRKKIGRGNTITTNLLKRISHLLIFFQKIVGIKRNKQVEFQKGANWFSITDSFARYLVEKKEWIEKVFAYTECGDEVFLQTILINSDYFQNVHSLDYDNSVDTIKRLIIFENYKPHVFIEKDLELLLHTSALFARKFDQGVSDVVVSKLYDKLKGDKRES